MLWEWCSPVNFIITIVTIIIIVFCYNTEFALILFTANFKNMVRQVLT